jgi:hypothetical protein
VTVGKDFPASSISEFIAEVKKKPGIYTYASAGAGSATHVASLLFLKSAGLDMVHAPIAVLGRLHRSDRRPSPDAVGKPGRTEAVSSASDKVKPLAISSKQRSKYLPDVPAIIETLPSPFVATYNGLWRRRIPEGGHRHDLGGNRCRRKRLRSFWSDLSKIGVEPSGRRPRKWRRRSPPICNVGVPSQDDVAPKGTVSASTDKRPIRTNHPPAAAQLYSNHRSVFGLAQHGQRNKLRCSNPLSCGSG